MPIAYFNSFYPLKYAILLYINVANSLYTSLVIRIFNSLSTTCSFLSLSESIELQIETIAHPSTDPDTWLWNITMIIESLIKDIVGFHIKFILWSCPR